MAEGDGTMRHFMSLALMSAFGLAGCGGNELQSGDAPSRRATNGESALMVDQELLSILVCPENKTPVKLADQAMIDQVNGAIAGGTLKNRAGEGVDTAIDGGLLREDGAYLYVIREDIPVMLIDEAIPMDQFGS
jgi:uncharacterized protein YbaR (Trm112 family)